jgi:tight adherence protein B
VKLDPLAVTLLVGRAAGVLVAGGLGLVAYGAAVRGDYPGKAQVARYAAYLDRTLRLCFVRATSAAILRGQAAGLLVAALVGVGFDARIGLVLGAAALVGPAGWLALERRRRVLAFDEQADGFILSLANSLKVVPNIGAAIDAVMPVVRDPIRQELGVVLGEMRVGSSVEQALLNASARARAGTFDAAVSALLVGRQVGGNLPKVLETTAATIREMNRLDGVVRTKTAEGKAQLWVLACFPFALCGMLEMVSPGYFLPLQASFVGHLIAGVAVAFWLGALVMARKILKVDL